MKKVLCALACAVSLLFCCGCDISTTTSLREISKPYTGEYQCQTLTLGGVDMLPKFDYVKLNLQYNGEFVLTYKEKEKKEHSFSGNYEMGEDSVTFTAKVGPKTATKSFPYENGILSFELNFLGKLLLATFTA